MTNELQRAIEASLADGHRLSGEDGIGRVEDLAWLGRLAHRARVAASGEKVTFQLGGDSSPQTCATVAYDGDTESLLRRLLLLRGRQDEGAGLLVVAPVPQGPVVAVDALRAFALCRLVMDNVEHVRCRWDDHGLDVAQLSLNFGADDLTGGVTGYRLTHDAPEPSTKPLEPEELAELIQDAGFTPIQRDADGGVVREFEPPLPAAIRRAEPQKVWA